MGKRKASGKPRVLSLCSGIGGIDLAAEWAGFEIACQCEIDPFCCSVLAKWWPMVKRVGDIRSVWGDTFDGIIHLIVAGFPCQPASLAGKRRGGADARWLWPEVLRVVQVYEPAWVLLENVAGLISLGLDGVLADLASAGYEAWPVVFPAAAVGASHQRERIFIVAHANGERRLQPQGRIGSVRRWTGYGSEDVAHANFDRCGNGAGESLTLTGSRGSSDAGASHTADVADTARQRAGSTHHETDAITTGGQAWEVSQRRGRWQAQSRVGGDADGLPRRLDGANLCPPRHSWPAGPGEAQHEWEPPRVTQERIPDRAKRLTALGNAVVPQQVYPVLAAIRAAMELHETSEEVSA